MNRFTLIRVILEFASALVLIGIAVYYLISGNSMEGLIFLGVGIIFILSPAWRLYKELKAKKKCEEEENNNNKRGFI